MPRGGPIFVWGTPEEVEELPRERHSSRRSRAAPLNRYTSFAVNETNVSVGDFVTVNLGLDKNSNEILAYARLLDCWDKGFDTYDRHVGTIQWCKKFSDFECPELQFIADELLESPRELVMSVERVVIDLETISGMEAVEVVRDSETIPSEGRFLRYEFNGAQLYWYLRDEAATPSPPPRENNRGSSSERGSLSGRSSHSSDSAARSSRRKKARTPRKTPRQPVCYTPADPLRTLQPSQLDSLPCREDEFLQITSFLESRLSAGSGGCMYVSGVPGTGKSATLHQVVVSMQQSSQLPSHRLLVINGLQLARPNYAFTEIWHQLSGDRFPPKRAARELHSFFASGELSEPIVLIVDELDALWSRKQEVLYALFDWPSTTQLIVLTVANTMDLPERLFLPRVVSRLGLTRLTFQPYTHDQLITIVLTKLQQGTNEKVDAIELAARKVAAVSGDARRVLDICSRANKLAAGGPLELDHVLVAVGQMFTSTHKLALKALSPLEQIIMRTVGSELQRLDLTEINLRAILPKLNSAIALAGIEALPVSVLNVAINKLASARLLLAQPAALAHNVTLQLCVSVDELLHVL